MSKEISNASDEQTSLSQEEHTMNRRKFIGAGSSALIALAALRAGAQDIQTVTKAQQARSASDMGPENSSVQAAQANTFMPPATDHGEVQTFWSSFSASHRRIQEGGWSRQVTVEDFPIAKELAGVNMRLIAGGCRELHWHAAAEWGIILNGKVRLTAMDNDGKGFVDDVGPGDLWNFPAGNPHSIQGLGPDGAEFLLVFDDGTFSEGNTTLISDWLRHTPPEVLAKNWGLAEKDVASVYAVPPDGKYIFKASMPGSLKDDQRIAAGSRGKSPMKFTFPLLSMKPNYQNKSGAVRIADSRNFKAASTIAAAHVVLKPGALRELHWHQNADEWQYYIQGKGRMTVFFTAAKGRTADFQAGDVGYVPRTFGHYIENVGDTDLIFLEMFKANQFQDLSVSEWVTHIPPELLKDTIGISKADLLSKVPETKQAIVPG